MCPTKASLTFLLHFNAPHDSGDYYSRLLPTAPFYEEGHSSRVELLQDCVSRGTCVPDTTARTCHRNSFPSWILLCWNNGQCDDSSPTIVSLAIIIQMMMATRGWKVADCRLRKRHLLSWFYYFVLLVFYSEYRVSRATLSFTVRCIGELRSLRTTLLFMRLWTSFIVLEFFFFFISYVFCSFRVALFHTTDSRGRPSF